jgi:hypothetical protein
MQSLGARIPNLWTHKSTVMCVSGTRGIAAEQLRTQYALFADRLSDQ